MTRLDYKIIASAISDAREKIKSSSNQKPERIIALIIEELCDSFILDNPRFSEEKFKEACE